MILLAIWEERTDGVFLRKGQLVYGVELTR
jgi:hypothetical protein